MSNHRFTVVFLLPLLLFPVSWLSAQSNTGASQPPDEKAEAIIKRATEALGGATYLNVQTVVGRGLFTRYQDGMPGVPAKFLDYVVYPNKERTEFVSSGIKVIQTNSADHGWLYDGATKSLHDMKPGQIEDFKLAMRTSYDNVLRGWWRKEGATLTYAGRREGGLAKRNETVRLTYPDAFWVEYEFGAKDGLPAKAIYKRVRQNADSGETVEFTEEDHFARFIGVSGINSVFVVDHFINGKQSSRINYESVEYNRPLPDTLFSKPESVKAIK